MGEDKKAEAKAYPRKGFITPSVPFAERWFIRMKEIQYEIVKEIAVLSKGDSGYTKEINLISWNGREPKYDIRSFSPNREKCGKGITLNADEAAALLEALQKEVNSGD